jgi:AraC-like DNA-binding protein
MRTLIRSSMLKQDYRPAKDVAASEEYLIRNMGLEHPEGTYTARGKDWLRHQVCRDDTFSLVAAECHVTDTLIEHTRQQDYIKINFWLSGKHTTVLDGFGQHTHDRPEVFITSGPWEMIKVDVINKETQMACVALCLLPNFFSAHMGLDADQLPEPLRTLVVPDERPFGFHRYPLTPDLMAAARAILSAPFAVRQQPIYGKAKAIELMCLLINLMGIGTTTIPNHRLSKTRHESRLLEARDLVMRRYSEALTLEQIAREVCLNRMALTSGFRQLFGSSVYDFMQKVRMERAYELLREKDVPISRVAESVGYTHSCNFSTAFHGYFGCTPQKARDKSTQ